MDEQQDVSNDTNYDKKVEKKITVADEKYLLKLEKQMSSDLEESRSVFCLQFKIKWFPSAMQDSIY